MDPIVRVENLTKTYEGGFTALDNVSLDIERGEVLALLGPNGAGKTTLISTICGIATPTSGTITVDGHDTIRDYRGARAAIGLVPQEINLEPFEKVIGTVRFSRGLFGRAPDDAHIERVLRQVSLWDRRDAQIRTLSGGMKRRVLIAKALGHEPRVLFLDEPTAGVDVELRREMWETVRNLKAQGVTIVLTTHYIEEAEAMADRVGVISRGRILLVEEKAALMRRMGQRTLVLELSAPVETIPKGLAGLRPRPRRRPASISSTPMTARGSGPASPGAAERFPGRGAGIARRADQAVEPRGDLRGPRPGRQRRREERPGRGMTGANLHAVRAIYQLRDGAVLPHRVAIDRLARDLHLALLRGVRRSDRQPHRPGRGRELRQLHRAQASSCSRSSPSRSRTPPSASTFRSSSARSMSLLSAPASFLEIASGYVLAAATKALIIGRGDSRDRLLLRRPDVSSIRSGW